MPIVRDSENKARLVCVNHADETHTPGAATMTQGITSFCLMGIDAARPNREATTVFPVRCYSCTICGYVELYSSITVDQPGTWPTEDPR